MLDEKTWLIMAVLVHPIENPVLSSSQAPPYQNHLNISAWALPCALWAVMLVGIWSIYAKKMHLNNLEMNKRRLCDSVYLCNMTNTFLNKYKVGTNSNTMIQPGVPLKILSK